MIETERQPKVLSLKEVCAANETGEYSEQDLIATIYALGEARILRNEARRLSGGAHNQAAAQKAYQAAQQAVGPLRELGWF